MPETAETAETAVSRSIQLDENDRVEVGVGMRATGAPCGSPVALSAGRLDRSALE